MSLSITWNWAKPNVVVPEGSKFRTSGAAQALDDIANAAISADQRQRAREQEQFNRSRQIMLDKQAEADRRRRIAEEERKKQAYADVEAILKGRDAKLSQLQAQREQIKAQIDQLEAELNG